MRAAGSPKGVAMDDAGKQILLKETLPVMSGRVVASIVDTMPATSGVPLILYDDSAVISETALYNLSLPRGVSVLLKTSEADLLKRSVDRCLAGKPPDQGL